MSDHIDREEAESILQSAPFHQFLGVTFAEYEEGHVVIECPFREEFLVNEDKEIVHGGVLSSLVDIAGHYAVLSSVDARVPTIDLRTDYLRPGRRGPFTVEAEVDRVGRNVAVADAEVRQEQRGETKSVTLGRGSYGVSHVE
ncbi:PaaI family thioesterase [Halopenitus salinus]|jgi:uncharacterized protein (TIGR00369 family)|uniref:PaaI family thioesterase n=1 Tax=Halopenitus salinus TaxID=1198295 RepID=A0ABD5UUK5_9EURY